MTIKLLPEVYVTIISAYNNEIDRKKCSIPDDAYPFHHAVHVFLHQALLTARNVQDIISRLKKKFKAFAEMLSISKTSWWSWSRNYLLDNTRQTRTFKEDSLCLAKKCNTCLEYAYFAFELMPPMYESTLVWITDGVSTLTVEHENFPRLVQSYIQQNIRCIVIELEPSDPVSQGHNFGHVQDSKLLKFLCSATGGEYTNSTELSRYTKDIGVRYVQSLFLVRQIRFTRSHAKSTFSSSYFSNRILSDIIGTTSPKSSLSWNLESKPPIVSEILARYREYTISGNIKGILEARLREGFNIENIVLLGGKKDKNDKIHFNLSLNWLPHVTIQYRIRMMLNQSLNSSFSEDNSNFRIQINIMAYRAFALCFVNIDSLSHRKEKERILVTKVTAVHNFLKALIQSDEHFKIVMSFNSKKVFYTVPARLKLSHPDQVTPSKLPAAPGHSDTFKAFHNFWHYLNYVVKRTKSCFDRKTFRIILTGFSKTSATYQQDVDQETYLRIKRASVYKVLYKLFVDWSSFLLNKSTFVKLVFRVNSEQPQGFIVLRVNHENDFLIQISMIFYNIDIESRQKEVLHFEERVDQLNESSREDSSYVMCQKSPQLYIAHLMLPGGKVHNEIEESIGLPASAVASHFMEHTFSKWQVCVEANPTSSGTTAENLTQYTFKLLHEMRIREGFHLLHEGEERMIYYLEFPTTSKLKQNNSTKAQVKYVLAKSKCTKYIETEIWVEPCYEDGSQDFVHLITQSSSSLDHLITTQLFSFDSLRNLLPKNGSFNDTLINALRHRKSCFSICSLIPCSVISVMLFDIPYLHRMEPYTPLEVEKRNRLGGIDPLSTYSRKSDTWIQENLNPILNIIYTYYFQHCLRNYCSFEISFEEYPDAYEKLFTSLTNIISEKCVKENVDFLQLISYRCFVTLTGMDSFYVIFFPRDIPDLQNVDNVQSLEEFLQTSQLHLFCFHCFLPKGQTALDPATFYRTFCALPSSRPLVSSDKDDQRSAATSHICFFPDDYTKLSENETSPQIYQHLVDLNDYCFTRVVYAKLLLGERVDEAEFLRSIRQCSEFILDIDITEYLNAIIITQTASTKSAQTNFQELLGAKFKEVLFSGDKKSNYYYFSPSDIFCDSNEHSNQSGKRGPKQLINMIMRLSESPLFLRVECSFQKTNSNSNFGKPSGECESTVSFPIDQLPESYVAFATDFQPDHIGSPTSPLASSDGTIANLHFICVVLPISKSLAISKTDSIRDINSPKGPSTDSLDLDEQTR
jgi:hypothetical protein